MTQRVGVDRIEGLVLTGRVMAEFVPMGDISGAWGATGPV